MICKNCKNVGNPVQTTHHGKAQFLPPVDSYKSGLSDISLNGSNEHGWTDYQLAGNHHMTS